ncbi:LysE family translocator [Celeribacter neptunius]|uniref:Threonine/homoserine/homoserine lactone efflux protein n=1 Tax=Celeribacter neptunius TaxID=588602 RepID=A0A1I3X414_9RHOB|nr:LysE family translocator [Celeribacter neptunius]SFK14059.1 Threonine/homoserine/homoserine lactone efflux protein [Celeribacter neptunius]
MIPFHDLWPILVGWAIAVGSPGPAVLAIVGAAMGGGRGNGLALAIGVWVGSLIWAVVAGLGLSAAMLAHVWLITALRYAGAAYLLFLALKSARVALSKGEARVRAVQEPLRLSWLRGFTIHLTNPKAILFWGSLYAVIIPPGSEPIALLQVGASCLAVSFAVMCLMALAFSTRIIARGYLNAHRVFEAAFAALFGYAALKVLTAKVVA